MLKQLAHTLLMHNTTPNADPRPTTPARASVAKWVAKINQRRAEAARLAAEDDDRSEDCNCGVPNPTPGRPFDCPMHGPRE